MQTDGHTHTQTIFFHMTLLTVEGTLNRVYTYSFIFSEKFELIKGSKSRLSQTDLIPRYKMLNGPALDILKRKQEYFADLNLDQCSVVKMIEIVQRLGLLLISIF